MFYFPHLTSKQFARLHGIAVGIPRINDPIYKCEPTIGKLYTNAYGGPTDWVLSPEGDTSEPVVIEVWPADSDVTTMDRRSDPKHNPAATGCTRLPIREGYLIPEYANGHRQRRWTNVYATRRGSSPWRGDKPSGSGQLG